MKRLNARIVALAASAFSTSALAVGALLMTTAPAHSVPSFAIQTGQQCAACHVGGFGPQLTALGREFKLRGYTMRSGEQGANVPFSAMAIASYLRTQRDQDEPPAPHYSRNDNTALDEASLFLASGFGDHFGAFVQATYDGIGHVWAWDNMDLRATLDTNIGDTSALLGVTLNNSPTTQDVWSTLPTWGFPYTDSGLAPGPAASPLLAGGLPQNVLGLSGYALWNSAIYTELGTYWSPSASFIDSLGVDPAETSEIDGVAPYVRTAYQGQIAQGNFEIGAFGLFADLFPLRDHSAGTDTYRDLGVDASYERTDASGHTFTVNARYTNEHQDLPASRALDLAENSNNTLNDFRMSASYYRHRFGGTVAAFDTWGSADPVLYASRTGSPNSSGLILQVDHTPWGEGSSPLGARFNARIGLQYTWYSEFDGARHNYDGLGRDAADNNTLRLYTWFAY